MSSRAITIIIEDRKIVPLWRSLADTKPENNVIVDAPMLIKMKNREACVCDNENSPSISSRSGESSVLEKIWVKKRNIMRVSGAIP
jgi:hypothetical protein